VSILVGVPSEHSNMRSILAMLDDLDTVVEELASADLDAVESQGAPGTCGVR
jgi:hypothetical protein